MSMDFLNVPIARERSWRSWMSVGESAQNPDCFDRSTVLAFTGGGHINVVLHVLHENSRADSLMMKAALPSCWMHFEAAVDPAERCFVEISPTLAEGATNPRLDCDASRLESAYLDVSMLEMKLNTTATVDAVGLDPINVVPYQKTRQLRDRTLVLQ